MTSSQRSRSNRQRPEHVLTTAQAGSILAPSTENGREEMGVAEDDKEDSGGIASDGGGQRDGGNDGVGGWLSGSDGCGVVVSGGDASECGVVAPLRASILLELK